MKIRRTGAAGLHVLVVPAVLEPDNQHPGGARGGHGDVDIVDNRAGGGNIKSGEVEIAALAGVGVLHIDNDQRALLRRKGQGFRASGQGNHQATS